MPCQIKIKQLLVEKVKDMSDHGLDKTIKYAKQVEKEVNSFFNSNVVYFTQEADFIGREITISDSLVKTYYDNELSLEQKADLQRKETGNYDVVDGEIVVSTNNGFNNEYSLNDFQEEQKELNKIVENINNIKFDENGQGLLFGNLQNLAKSNRIAVGEIKVENKKITGFNKKPNPYLRDYNTDLTEVQAKKLFEKTNKSTKDYEGLAVYFANMFVNEIIDKDVHLKMGYMRLAEYSQQKPKILITDTNKKINPFYQYNNTIIVGIYQLQQLLENGNYSDYQKFQNLIQSVAQEESIHLFAEYLLSKETVDNIYSEMSEKDIQKIKDIYENENLDKNGIVHEYVRMVVQQHVFNSTTEQEKVKLTNSVLDFISKMINEIQQFLSEIIGQNNTQKTIEDVINFTKGNFSKELDDKITDRIFNKGQILEANLNVLNNFQEEQKELDEIVEDINNYKPDILQIENVVGNEIESLKNDNDIFIEKLNDENHNTLKNKLKDFTNNKIVEFSTDETLKVFQLFTENFKNILKKENVSKISELQAILNSPKNNTSLINKIINYFKKLFLKSQIINLRYELKNNTKNIVNEYGQELINDINSSQQSNKQLINTLLYKSIIPGSYNKKYILKNILKSLFIGRNYNSFKNDLSKMLKETSVSEDVLDIVENMTIEQYNKREDAWRLSNGLPQKHNTFRFVGKGVLTNGELTLSDKGENVYEFNNPEFVKDANIIKKGRDTTNFVMGNYYVTDKKDDIGHYIQYNDRWDIDLSGIIQKIVNITQNPFIVTGKIYYALEYDENGNFEVYLTYDNTDKNIKHYSDFVGDSFDDILQAESSLEQDIKYQLSKEQSDAIDNVFDENPELANALTKGQYRDYINSLLTGETISNQAGDLSKSSVKDVLYHGSLNKIETFDKNKLGSFTKAASAKEAIFFTNNIEVAKTYAVPKNLTETEKGRKLLEEFDVSKITPEEEAEYGLASMYEQQISEFEDDFDFDSVTFKRGLNKINGWKTGTIYEYYSEIYPSILNLKNPKIKDFENESYREESYFEIQVEAKNNNNDGTILKNTFDGRERWGVFNSNIYTVFEPSQIHIMGSKSDIEQAKEFISNKRKIGTNENIRQGTSGNNEGDIYLQEKFKEANEDFIWSSEEGYRYSFGSLSTISGLAEKAGKSQKVEEKRNNSKFEIGRGVQLLSNNSNIQEYSKQSFREIWQKMGEPSIDLEANILGSAFVVQRIFQKSNKFSSRILSSVKQEFEISTIGEISLEYIQAPLWAEDNKIGINLFKIDRFAKTTETYNLFLDKIDKAIEEESIHFAINQIASKEELLQVYKEMTDEQKKLVKEIYEYDFNLKNNHDQFLIAHEFIRMIIQDKYTGEISESSNPILLGIINRLINKVKEWLGTEAIKTNEILNRFDNLVNKPQFNISEKSKELSNLPNNKWFNRTIQPIINRFSKMFPNVRSVVINEKEIPNEVKSIVDGLDKQINSFFHKGQVYIIKERVTKDIAIEEFLHPFINALEQDNPELYKSLLLEAKKLFPELKEEVFTKYDKVYNSIFDKNREFLTQALTQKVSEQTPEQETFFQKFKTWIRNILDRLFGNEATTREISMLDETMSLTDLASILNENNTQFNFNSDTNTTYYSLNEEEITNYLNRPKTQIQAEILDKILENNEVTQTDFTGGRHEYTRNELGEILQLKPVSNFLSKKINPELDFSDFAQIGNAIHEIVKNINLNLLPRTQLIDAYAEKSDLKRILVDEKGYPIEAVKQILSNIYDYVTPLIGSKESLLVSEVSISALQDLGEYKGVAGTIDLLEITKDGNLVIHDFKSMYLNGLETYVYTNNPSTQLDKKFNVDNNTAYREQLSLYAKMLKGIVGNKNITLQIVPIGYLATSETKDKTIQVNFSDKLVKTNASLNVENYIYSPFNLMNVSKQQAKFQVTYFKSFVDKILPSIKDEEITKKLTKEEIDRQELLNNLTDEIKGENSKVFEAEIEKVFKQITTVVTQYGNSQNELNRELYKIFDPKGELKETKANFEAIFETIKEMGEDNPEKLKHYLSTFVQYINYIEETNVGLSNIKSHFYKIVANDAKLDNQTLISDMRRSYLLAKSHEKGINSILGQLGDIKEDNGFKQLLRNSISYVAEIENLYFKKSLPLIANVLNSYFGKEFRDSMSKEIQDRLNKEKYDLNLATSDNAKIRINNKILKLEEQLKMIPNPNLIADIIQGKYGDSDWFYSNLMANINNPDYVISGTESFMTDIMRDLSLIAIKQEEEFARQFSKREDTLKVNKDQVKEMNKDLVYASNHLVKKADGTTEVLKSMTLLTEVNEDVYFDYEVLQDQLLKTEPNTPERKVISDKIKQFENEHFESEFNPRYLKALSAIDVVVSDGRNVKQVRQAILDKIKAIKVSNYKLNYLQGELESEDDLVELRELWREFMNLSSTIDRNGNKKTGADLEIADILQARKKELEEFRDKKVDEDLWKKLKAKKIQSLLGKYNTEEEVLKSEEYKKWQSFNSVISPTEEFYELRQLKLNAINLILDKKEYKDISLVGQLKDNLNQSWEKLLAISREYRDFEREIISGDIPEGTKKSMKVLEENINKVKTQIKGLEKSLSKQDKKDLNTLWEEYNSMIEYKNSKYYEEDFESALNQYALENGLEVSELRNDAALMTQFRLNNEWYINSHIIKERFDKLTGETIKYSEPVYYYKVVIPTDSNYIKESPASQYASFELKPEAYNLDEDGKPNYLDVFGRKRVKKSSKYITENIPYLKIKNDLSLKGRVNFENLEFLKKEMEEAQKGLNKQNYLYYQIPANRKSTFERVSEGDIKGVKENIKAKFSINPQDETELGTRGVLANLSGEEARFIPVLGKSKIDFNDQSYNIWKSILDYTLSAQKAKMFEEKLPILDVLVDQLEKNLPAVDGNKNEAIGESMSKKFNLENVKEVIKGRGDKRVQAVKDTVARYVYEEFTKELANIGGISDIKLTNTLLGYSGATMMVGNIPNWIVNAMSGNIQLMIEAAGKRYFTSKDVKNAKIELMSRHKDAIADYTKTHDKSLFGQMIEYFDPVKGEFMDNLGNKFDWSKRTNIKQIFFSGKIYGEWEMQMTTFIAMLKAKKVTQIINGVEKTIDLYDAFEKGEDGIPKLKEGVQITDRELKEYMTRIQGVNKLLNGSYAKLDQTKIEKYSLGRMAIFMKKFFIPLFVNRFGKFRGDSELQDVREGHYISFYNAIVKDMLNLPIGEIYAKMKKSPEDGGYTDLQKAAITKTLTEIAFITALTIILVMLGYDDDEDDSDAKKFAQYIALKLRREVATFTPVAAPQEFASFFSRPFAAMSSTGNLINLGGMILKTPINVATGAFEDDLYYQRKTSMWDAGDSKFLALLYKSIGLKLNIAHPDQLLQGYNYSIRL